MTRFLSESLEAEEPYFRLGLQRLEKANGNPSMDIRLTSEVMRATRTKLAQLNLDPNNTTPEELYAALKQRVKEDDAKLTFTLRYLAAVNDSAEADPVAGIIRALRDSPDSKRCFALKPAKLKSIIKLLPPKKTMKKLGYRSLDSMLKHEPVPLIFTAAWLIESVAWRGKILSQYKKLKPIDFEERSISLFNPRDSHWKDFSAQIVDSAKNNVLAFRELGALILLPLPKVLPDGAITAGLSLALHQLNEIRASSTYLKLNQTRGDFGQAVLEVATEEPALSSELLDRPVPWSLIQHYYSKLSRNFKEEVFEPYVHLEDMVWHPIEKSLAAIEPRFSFWKNTASLGLAKDVKPVSLNVRDNALNLCNSRQFEQRVAHHFQESLWHELLLGYLKLEQVEQSVLSKLQPQFAMEPALV
jgi:hypothetical protein